MCSRCLTSSLMLCELLIILSKLVIYKLVNILTEFNSTLRSVVLAVPPCEIVT